MMMFHPDQADTNCKHIQMTCKAFSQLPLDVDGIYDRIDTQMIKTPHILLLLLAALGNRIKPDIGKLKKERGYIF